MKVPNISDGNQASFLAKCCQIGAFSDFLAQKLNTVLQYGERYIHAKSKMATFQAWFPSLPNIHPIRQSLRIVKCPKGNIVR